MPPHARCQSSLELTVNEVTPLIRLPDGAHVLAEVAICELEDNHPGPHVSLGQTDGEDQDWWIRWTHRGAPTHLLLGHRSE